MLNKGLLLVFLYTCIFILPAQAQQAPLNRDSVASNLSIDSLDSALVIPITVIDSITPQNLRPLDSLSKALIVDSLKKGFGYPKVDFDWLIKSFLIKTISQNSHQIGNALPQGEAWVLGLIALLLVVFAVLKRSFSKQLLAIIQSFFSNRALVNLNKEDNLFTSWPFLLLFIQFGFTIGMFFYLVAQNQNLTFVANGFQSFVTISIVIIVLYVAKILLLRLLGYVFSIQKPVNEYISILYLSYFNTSLLFMPLVIAFALSPLKYGNLYIAIAMILVGIIFVFQFIRAGINILSHYRFSKVYLFLYFCTLEICPILILIKAIGF